MAFKSKAAAPTSIGTKLDSYRSHGTERTILNTETDEARSVNVVYKSDKKLQ